MNNSNEKCPLLDTCIGACERDTETSAKSSTKSVVCTTYDNKRSMPAPQQTNRALYAHGQRSKSIKLFIISWRLLRCKSCLILLVIALLTILSIKSTLPNAKSYNTDIRISMLHYSHVPGVKGYFVWSESCKMPYIEPYSPEVMQYFKQRAYEPCANKKPLTRVTFDVATKHYVLQVNENQIRSYSFTPYFLRCCYQSIKRATTGERADLNISFTECMRFKKKITLPSTIDNILVKCSIGSRQVYINAHAMMPERREIRKRLEMWRQRDKYSQKQSPPRPLNVLMIGIDSISRINLIRAMPKTTAFLHANEWFEMSGYNKIEDNTFPNLMAVLTGRNKTNIYNTCSPKAFRGLDKCSFIWQTFREHGYVTAYAEDQASINTFNYEKLGFERPPVDFYLRPFFLGAENNLTLRLRTGLIYCLGYQHSAEFVYDYAIELATRFTNDPFFGLFWTNTFSHEAIGDSSSMDALMVDYLKKFTTLKNTIVIFFSDHGMRFGPTRKTHSGHLEERLPFMFLSLPQHLKREYPKFVQALSMNKNRLTNPYDLHMTLKHVLAMTKRVKNKELLRSAEACARCQTLFEPVPYNRSCADIAIEDHWCTCIPYHSISNSSGTVYKLAQFAIDYINDYVAGFENGSMLCVPLTLYFVENAFRAEQLQRSASNSSTQTYRIVFRTMPNRALFEATILHRAVTETFQITGEVSRLSLYSSESKCVSDSDLKKYCLCHEKKEKNE